MTRVSKKKLERSAWQRIHRQFSKTVLNLKRNKFGREFLSDLITEAETIVLAKRLAIIFLLLEKVPQRRISESLKVSTSTIRRIGYALDHGGFQAIKSLFKEKKQREEFWKEVGIVLRLGMPPYTGKGRWAWLDELDKKYHVNK